MPQLGRITLGIALAGLCGSSAAAEQEKGDPRAVLGADEVFWVPTMDQAVEMAQATGKPIFSMGYSLVPDGTTYTKLGDSCPRGVF
jgi:hypothetical protein